MMYRYLQKITSKFSTITQQVTAQLFSKLDIRIGNILQCWKHPQSDNLYCEKVQISTNPPIIRQIGSGLQKQVPIEIMTGKVLIMANLKPRKLRGFPSEGMVLCALTDQPQNGIDCWPLFVEGEVGQRVVLEGHEDLFPGQQLLKHVNTKKKIPEKCLPYFKTDSDGYVTWKDHKLKISTGYIQSQLKNGRVQ